MYEGGIIKSIKLRQFGDYWNWYFVSFGFFFVVNSSFWEWELQSNLWIECTNTKKGIKFDWKLFSLLNSEENYLL